MDIDSIIEFFQHGEKFMYPLYAVFAVGIAISLERFIYLVRMNRNTAKIWSQLVPMLKANDFGRAVKLVDGVKTPLAVILTYGFTKLGANRKREAIEAAMEEGMMDVMPDVVKRTHYLATFANIATMLGLVGTIFGLIRAFTAVSNVEPSEKASALASSISIAMSTTAMGLMTAIVLVLAHSYLVTKTSKLIDNLEKAAMKTLNMIIKE
jgi:biopolymer transport protein ExbB